MTKNGLSKPWVSDKITLFDLENSILGNRVRTNSIMVTYKHIQEIHDLWSILLKLYDDFLEYAKHAQENPKWIIESLDLITQELIAKERELSRLLRKVWNLEQEIDVNSIDDDLYTSFKCRIVNFRSAAKSFFRWMKKWLEDKVFEWFDSEHVCNTILESKKGALEMMDFYEVRFLAFQCAYILSLENDMIHSMAKLDFRAMNNELMSAWIKDSILFHWIDMQDIFDGMFSIMTRNIYFFWLVKEFYALLTDELLVINRSKPLFSPDVVEDIKKRITIIDDNFWYPYPLD